MPKENYKYKISIVLVSYRGFCAIAHSISSILLQEFDEYEYELIVVNHGVGNGIVMTYPLTVIKNLKTADVPLNPEIPYEPCKVYNAGINMAEGKLVFIMHDNTDLVGKDYFEKLWLLSDFGNKGVHTTKQVLRYDKNGAMYQNLEIQGFYGQQDAVPLEFLKKVKGFDEIYDGDNGYCDVDLFERCKRAGCEFYSADKNELLSIKHNMRDLYPKQKTENGSRNLGIYRSRGFV